MKQVSRIVPWLIGLLFLCGGYLLYTRHIVWWLLDDYAVVRVSLKEHPWSSTRREFLVEVVKGQAAVTLGLSNRADLVSYRDGTPIDGVLFLFPDNQIRHFWMKDMRFVIDMCWLAFPEILSCARNAPPPLAGEMPARFNSFVPVSAVLETKPGFFSDADVGSKLFFQWW